MAILSYYLSFSGRLIMAFLTGFAAGCLLVKWAEQLISRKTWSKSFFISQVMEKDRLQASVLMAFGSGILLQRDPPDWHLLFCWLFFCILFLSGYTDYWVRIIPNEGIVTSMFLCGLFDVSDGKTFSMIILEFLFAVLFSSVILSTIVILEKWKKRQMLGRGDIKLLLVTALFLGVEKTLYVLALACICGLMVFAINEKIDKRRQIPFGPCIAFSGFLMLLI